MEIFQGTATFQGIAIGKIRYIQKYEQMVLQYTVENARKELERFEEASRQVKAEVEEICRTSGGNLAEQELQLLQEQLQLLSSPSFFRAIQSLIYNEKVNAGYAVGTTRDELVSTFSRLKDPCVKLRMEGLRDVSERLIARLNKIPRETALGEDPVILAAEELTLTSMIELDQSKMLAVLTRQGSRFSHTTILAKTMNVPAVICLQVEPSWDGRLAIVDGFTGTVYLDPDDAVYQKYQSRRQEWQKEHEDLLRLRGSEDVTQDGHRVGLYANIGNLSDLSLVHKMGARGIGLLRSEFQYLGRENYPRESELFRAYCMVAQAMGDQPVVIRTVDLGGDKQAAYMGLPKETNPLMGNRGIRICLDRKSMFEAQLRAIYRASTHGNLRIMYPMITSVEEIYQIREIVKEVKANLDQEKIPYKDVLQGVMIETPAGALVCRELAREADFISLGTNDLTQYLLAMDRQNPWLKEKYDEHHPAVFRTIEMVIRESHKESCPVCICGELAGEKELVPRFLAMGVDSLSVVPANILPVRKAIRETCLSKEEET